MKQAMTFFGMFMQNVKKLVSFLYHLYITGLVRTQISPLFEKFWNIIWVSHKITQAFDHIGTMQTLRIHISIPSRRRGKIGDIVYSLPEGISTFVPIGTDLETMMSQSTGKPSSLPPIPSAVTKELRYVDTKSLYYNGDAEIHLSFAKKVYTQRRPLWTNAEQIEVLPHCITRSRRFLYHGANRRDVFYMSLGLGQRPLWAMNGNDFGPGLYFSFDPMVAKAYAGSGGVFITVDWTTEGASLTKKILRGEEWTEQVKNYTRMGTTEGNVAPQRFEEDFVIGPTCANHQVIRNHGDPIPGKDDQVMARTLAACDYMSRNLVSIIWLE
jgi:hypothetical protein